MSYSIERVYWKEGRQFLIDFYFRGLKGCDVERRIWKELQMITDVEICRIMSCVSSFSKFEHVFLNHTHYQVQLQIITLSCSCSHQPLNKFSSVCLRFYVGRWGWKDRVYIEDTLQRFRDGKFPIDVPWHIEEFGSLHKDAAKVLKDFLDKWC